MTNRIPLILGASALALSAGVAQADQVINDDLIVDGSACVGFDCSNGESFGFDTIRVKENNVRIHFDDTSTSASFPKNDWRFVANDTNNGGGSYMAIEDSTAGRQVFRVDAGAGANALRVSNSGGNIGFGTSTPVVELHIVDGDTPTIRLEQDGSSGFTPQTFDIAANETNFFVRDVTNGSKLPFRSRPGAPTSSIDIAASGNVGLNTASPQEALHIVRTATGANTEIRLESTGHSGAGSGLWELITRGADGEFAINDEGTAGAEFIFRGQNASGAVRPGLTVLNDVVAAGFYSSDNTIDPPDYVFADDYELMPLSEVAAFIDANHHLPRIPSAAQIKAEGLNLTQMQMSLLEKVEELTLYTLEQQKVIEALQTEVNALR